jgi:hypothetical protein
MLFSCREKLSRSFMAGMIEQHKMKLPIHVVLYFIPIITLFLFLIHYFVNYVYIYIFFFPLQSNYWVDYSPSLDKKRR